MKSENIFVRVRAEVKEQLQALAKNDKRSLSDYIRIILEDHIKNKGVK